MKHDQWCCFDTWHLGVLISVPSSFFFLSAHHQKRVALLNLKACWTFDLLSSVGPLISKEGNSIFTYLFRCFSQTKQSSTVVWISLEVSRECIRTYFHRKCKYITSTCVNHLICKPLTPTFTSCVPYDGMPCKLISDCTQSSVLKDFVYVITCAMVNKGGCSWMIKCTGAEETLGKRRKLQ